MFSAASPSKQHTSLAEILRHMNKYEKIGADQDGSNTSSYGEITEGSMARVVGMMDRLGLGHADSSVAHLISSQAGAASAASKSPPSTPATKAKGRNTGKIISVWRGDPFKFADIGSGFCKMLAVAGCTTGATRLYGLELVRSMVDIFNFIILAACEKMLKSSSGPLAGKQFETTRGDASHVDYYTQPDHRDIAYIYSFDQVFPPKVLTGVAQGLNAMQWRVFISFRNEDKWRAAGLNDFSCIDRLKGLAMRGSGEQHTAYVYAHDCFKATALQLLADQV